MERPYFPISLATPVAMGLNTWGWNRSTRYVRNFYLICLRGYPWLETPLLSYLASWDGDNQNPTSQQLMAELLPAWASSSWLEQSCPPSRNAYLVLLTGRQINFIVLGTTEFGGFLSYSSFSLLYNTTTESILQDVFCKVFSLSIDNNQTI